MSYKVNTVREITYQAAGSTTGLTDVTMEIYDETGAKDGVNFPDVTMAEIGTTGRYKGSFTPDAEGKWRVMINSATKPGQIVKDFEIVGHDVDSVGDDVATVDGKVVTVDGKIDTVDGKITALNDVSAAEVNTEVDTALADYDVAKGSDIVSPPMVG
jgi:hypothetical protein